ncbi:hypothetical protein QZH41_014110, partial [Actinostola sp. cb2023]
MHCSTSTKTASLQRAVCNYKSHIAQITDLRKETKKCLDEIQSIINLERKKELAEHAVLHIPDSDLSNRLPSVLFIGSQNCGKSSLLNVFLRESNLLPTDETPCTSRIVRIVYSANNYTKTVDPKTNQARVKPFKRKVAKDLIVLKGDDRQDSDQLNVIVEVGLNHSLLECGIELIDSPGRNENEALDRVVEEFVQKGIVPLIVYVVDGNSHLRENDRTTIRELQDKFPNVSLMFVCNKVDVEKNAQIFDEEEEKDAEDGTATCAFDESQELFDRARQKKIAVFKQLKRLDFLPSDDEMDYSELFHGVSAKLVRKARKKKLRNEATMSFERFELCILEKLESSLRKASRRELAALLSAQEMFLSSVVGTQRNMASATRVLKADYQRAMKTEESIFNMISHLITKGDSITNAIGLDLEKLSGIFLQEAQDYQYTKETKEQAQVIEFCSEMKGTILDRTFYVLKRSFQRILKKSLVNSVLVTELMKAAAVHPLLSRMLHRTLGGNETGQHQRHSADQDPGVLGIYIALENVLESITDEVDSLIREQIKKQLHEFDINQVGNQTKAKRPTDLIDKLGKQHPHLLGLSGWYFPVPDQLYIVMEKAECDLLTALRNSGLQSWKRRKEVAIDVAKGLEAIHRVEYVYQDLKPQNVM